MKTIALFLRVKTTFYQPQNNIAIMSLSHAYRVMYLPGPGVPLITLIYTSTYVVLQYTNLIFVV